MFFACIFFLFVNVFFYEMSLKEQNVFFTRINLYIIFFPCCCCCCWFGYYCYCYNFFFRYLFPFSSLRCNALTNVHVCVCIHVERFQFFFYFVSSRILSYFIRSFTQAHKSARTEHLNGNLKNLSQTCTHAMMMMETTE